MIRPSWWQRRGAVAMALLPVGFAYALLDAAVRLTQSARRAPLPMICVGNLTVGGAGKTPVTQALAKLLLDLGERPAVLSRGYGRIGRNAVRVEAQRHSALEVGDEPLLHAGICPTYVGSDRLETAHMAQKDGARVLLLDDGLQHHRIHRDLSLEVRNADDGLGNGWPLPAGPLRQWFGLGAGSVDLRICVGQDAQLIVERPPDLPQDRPLAAFCGIADPQKFLETLAKLNLDAAEFRAFPDHHNFTALDLAALESLSQSHALVTTQKDWVRLPKDLQAQVHAIPYAVAFTDPEIVKARLLETLRAWRQGQEGNV